MKNQKKPENKKTTESTKINKKASPVKKTEKKGLIVPVYNQQGTIVSKVTLPKEIFEQKPNPVLVAQAARVYLANQKPKTASIKTRAEVSGGGRKPHRQKGTGRARVGSIRVPQWRGGGVVFGPKPSSTLLSLPKKIRQKALTNLLSDKFSKKAIIFIDKINFKEPKTKKASQLLIKIPLENKKKLLLVLEKKEETTTKSFRNLQNIEMVRAMDLNSLDVLKSSGLIFSIAALQQLEERFKHENKKDN